MSDLTILFADRRPKLGALAIDGSISESHSHAARVTQYPVESGADHSDHIQDEPVRVTIDGFVSNTPAKLLWQADPEFDPIRHITSRDKLVELMESKQPFTLVTSLHVYTQMIIESLEFERSFESTGVLRFTADLRRIDTAFTSFAEAKVAEEIEDLASKATNLAMQGSIKADQATAQAATEAV